MPTPLASFRPMRRLRGLAIAACLAVVALVHGPANATAAKRTTPVAVAVDIVPGDPSSRVVLEGRGSITAAVLAGDAYDVAAIDPASLVLSGASVNKERVSLADVDGDGRADLVFRVRRALLRAADDARSLTLRGTFRDGRPLAGTAPIVVEKAALSDPDQEKQPVVPVSIDVMPGAFANVVDPGAKEDLVVAIFGNDVFDAGKANPETLDLAGAPVSRDEDDEPVIVRTDIDGDGRLDMRASFPRRLLRVAPGSATVELRGATAGGRGFAGSDAIVLEGPALTPSPQTPASSATFTNAAPITIPAGAPGTSSGPASPYPSNIVVSDLPGFVQFVSVTLHGLSHSFPDDLDVLLVGPGGQNLVLMSDVGGSSDASGITLTIADSGATPLPDEGALASGVYRPANVGSGDAFPVPAPAPSTASALSAFNGSEPNGTWRLYILDDNVVDFGSIAGGWSLTIGTSLTQICNSTTILVPGSGSEGVASPYPSTISVSGLLGTVTHATVSLRLLFHPYPDDIDLLLTGPGGGSAIVMSDAGGGTSTGGSITLNLDDAAPIPVPDEAPLQSGTFRPANYDLEPDGFPAPAPAPTGNTALSVFNGQDPNGDWSLYAVDDAAVDGGFLQSGWCLTLTTTSCAGRPPCNDGNPCTDDACDAATGRCTFTADDTNACTDGNACTTDACVAGSCVSTPGIAAFRFSSASSIVIPAGAPGTTIGSAAPYPSTITVPPLGGSVSDLTVTLDGFGHTFPDDVDVLLVAPNSVPLVLMSDVGLDTDVSGVGLTFSDAASASLPDAGPLVSGVYRPTNFGDVDAFPPPAPVTFGTNTLSLFDGANPAGVWKLYVADDASQETGAISGGWSLTIHVDCDDGNECTDDACDPATGCVHVNNTGGCDDHNVCFAGDHCEDGVCQPGGIATCYDDANPCTDDRCDPEIGCIFTPNAEPCDDHDPCTTDDRCGDGVCQAGGPADCSDGNPCTDDTCSPATNGCAHADNTAPCSDGNACTAGDTCAGGTCHPGAASVCDDGNVCTDDACDPAGGCVFTTNNTCNTRGNGYWKQLCRGPHSGDALTAYDVDCVNDSCTFAQVASIAGLCDRLDPQPPNDKCEQAEADFMGLLLNLCRRRVTAVQSIDSRCGPHQTVDASREAADAALCDPARDFDSCLRAECAASEIANGSALGANSLRVRRVGDGIRLDWEPPYVAEGSLAPHRFRIFRRPSPATPAVQIGEVNESLSFLDPGAAAGAATYVYEVVTVW